MNKFDQINKMRLLLLDNVDDDSKDELFEIFLDRAKNIYLTNVYPFNHKIVDIDKKDEKAMRWVMFCAIELYNINKNKLANVTHYSENGISFTFDKAGLSKDLLDELPPPKASTPSKVSEDK